MIESHDRDCDTVCLLDVRVSVTRCACLTRKQALGGIPRPKLASVHLVHDVRGDVNVDVDVCVDVGA